ncbi:hypothetical protein [Nonomuraea sp. B19D2]|uniref:hypothetical protein n=1 Tax=Nonomuraea sp. B19D2 TaxID=3159561 RepID=UPI0032DBE2F0
MLSDRASPQRHRRVDLGVAQALRHFHWRHQHSYAPYCFAHAIAARAGGREEFAAKMVAPLTQSAFSSDGGCSSVITGPAANDPAHVDLTCHTGEKAVFNKMKLEVVGIAKKAAVIRIRPKK